MKNLLQKFSRNVGIAVGTLLFMTMPFIASAQSQQGVTTDQLLHPFNYTSGAPSDSKVGIVSNIAKNTSGDLGTILSSLIKFILAITGTIAFISFSYAGVLMVTARGNEDQIKKGKDIILWSIIALAIIAGSYAVVLGVSQLKF